MVKTLSGNTPKYTNFNDLRKAYNFNYKDKNDRCDLTEEEERNYVNDCFDLYEYIGFSDTFQSPYEQSEKDNGKKFTVLRRVSEEDDRADLCCLPLWVIQFEDGRVDQAYPEEICKAEISPLNGKAADNERKSCNTFSGNPSKYRDFDELYKAYGLYNSNKTREDMTGEEEKRFVEDLFDLYETVGFLEHFDSPYEEYNHLVGKPFTVIGRLTETCDTCILPMWKIRIAKEESTNEECVYEEFGAYPEEICKAESSTPNNECADENECEFCKAFAEENFTIISKTSLKEFSVKFCPICGKELNNKE